MSPRSVRAIVWSAGFTALLVAVVAWVLPAQPYQAPWAWISFIGMGIVDDFVVGSREDADEVRARFTGFEPMEAYAGTDPFGSHWHTLRRR